MGSHIGQWIKHHVLFCWNIWGGLAFGFCCLWVFCSLVFCVCVLLLFFLKVFIELQWWKLVWFVVWHFWIVTVCLTKGTGTIDLYLNGIDWLSYCISDLPDKRLNRTLKSHRKLLYCMFNILWDLFVLLLITYKEIISAYSSSVLHQLCTQYCFNCQDSDAKIVDTKMNMEGLQHVDKKNDEHQN